MDIKKATAIVDEFAEQSGYYDKFTHPLFVGMLENKYVFQLPRNGKGRYIGPPFLFLVSESGEISMINGLFACERALDALKVIG